MRRLALGLIVLAFVSCGKTPTALPSQSFQPKLLGAQLFRCDDPDPRYPVGSTRGCAILTSDGQRASGPGSKEVPVGPTDTIYLEQQYARWAYFQNIQRAQAELCWLNPKDNNWYCTWNWVSFTSAGPVTDSIDVGHYVQEIGDWVAFFTLHWPGSHMIILRGESNFGPAVADTLYITITDSLVAHKSPVFNPAALRDGTVGSSSVRIVRILTLKR